ncbi:hypothetical protein [Acetobacter aceti]|uniref:hypothetical protein n=1 Tax=Acetobacter aceti TaxID=435 RepID=UPI001CA3ECD0|nr:hypothetical protein [Acetobacter aceti]
MQTTIVSLMMASALLFAASALQALFTVFSLDIVEVHAAAGKLYFFVVMGRARGFAMT